MNISSDQKRKGYFEVLGVPERFDTGPAEGLQSDTPRPERNSHRSREPGDGGCWVEEAGAPRSDDTLVAGRLPMDVVVDILPPGRPSGSGCILWARDSGFLSADGESDGKQQKEKWFKKNDHNHHQQFNLSLSLSLLHHSSHHHLLL